MNKILMLNACRSCFGLGKKSFSVFEVDGFTKMTMKQCVDCNGYGQVITEAEIPYDMVIERSVIQKEFE